VIIIQIWGEPIGKGRPRLGKGRVHTPEKTRAWEKKAAFEARRQYHGEPLEGPIDIDVQATFSVPKSWPLWKQLQAEDGMVVHTIKPDASNVLKAVEDALQGIVFRDDSQIAALSIEKWYGAMPGIQVNISKIDFPHSKSNRSECSKPSEN
jgi:Holliday junction resolvase RusA-like endonuclease